MKSRMNPLVAVSLLVFQAASLLAFCEAGQAQNLVYALSYSETRASRQGRYPFGMVGMANVSIHDRLAMLRQYRKTEIFSVSMIDGKRTLLFSDEGMDFEITPIGSVSGPSKAYVTGVERQWRTGPSPGAFADPPAIYEINLGGSRQFHRIFETQPNQSPALLNLQGTKAAFQSFVDGKYVVSIYEVPAWKLLHTWELAKIVQAHCQNCSPLSFGWLADGNRLFFNLDIVDDEGEGDDSVTPVPGIYLASENGADLGALSPDIGRFQLPGYVHGGSVNHRLLGQLSNGSYVFQDYASREGHHMADLEPFLVISSPDSKIFPQRRGFGASYLSPSGKYLAYIEERQVPNYHTEWHLWGKDIQTGEEKELVVAPQPDPNSTQPNVTLHVLGWSN